MKTGRWKVNDLEANPEMKRAVQTFSVVKYYKEIFINLIIHYVYNKGALNIFTSFSPLSIPKPIFIIFNQNSVRINQ